MPAADEENIFGVGQFCREPLDPFLVFQYALILSGQGQQLGNQILRVFLGGICPRTLANCTASR